MIGHGLKCLRPGRRRNRLSTDSLVWAGEQQKFKLCELHSNRISQSNLSLHSCCDAHNLRLFALHKLEAQMAVLQSRKRLGQTGLRVGRRRRRDGKKRGGNKMDQQDFVTFALMNVKHSVTHRAQIGDCFKENEERKVPITLGLTTPSHHAVRVPLYNCAVTVTWLENGSMGTTQWERSTGNNGWNPPLVEKERCAPRAELTTT